jgi:hypothetical protein
MIKHFMLALLLLPLMSIAQSNFKTGYVVNLKGDTLHGYINYKEWGHNPQSITFKSAETNKAQELGTADINYFEINDYVSYHAYRVSVSLNPVDISSPPSIADTASETNVVFLKVLQKGKAVTLYAYQDGLKERFYVKDNTIAVPNELLYGIYQDPNNADKLINKATYQTQLNQLAAEYKSGDDKLARQIQQSGYKESDVVSIITKINGNTETHPSSKPISNPKERFFVGGALISSTLKDGAYYGSPSSNSIAPKIVIGADMLVNPDVGHLIFRMELGYTANNFSFTEISNPLDNIANPQTNYIKIKQNVIFITPQVVYNIYNAAMLKIFIDLGYSVNILSYPKDEVTTNQNGQAIAKTNLNQIPDAKNNYSAFQFKAGVVVSKRFEIYGAYEPGAQITDSYVYSTNLSSYTVGLNYFLGRVAH